MTALQLEIALEDDLSQLPGHMSGSSHLPATLALGDSVPSCVLCRHPCTQAHSPTQTHLNKNKPKPK